MKNANEPFSKLYVCCSIGIICVLCLNKNAVKPYLKKYFCGVTCPIIILVIFCNQVTHFSI